MKSLKSKIEYVMNAQFDQLGKEEWLKILKIQGELKNAQFDQLDSKAQEEIQVALGICDNLIDGKTVYRVEFYDGDVQNGGQEDFWTEEEALEEIDEMKDKLNGWTSRISEPKEISLKESDLGC
jgi:hypothetical protein